jgi:UDP-N-acetyl-2-amino-2-deoxyglucuronate dehydrogenase
MGNRIAFGIMGCGRVSSKHLDALSDNIEGASLAAVCDIDPEKAKKSGETYKVPHYTSANEMLEKHPEIQVINILTPSGLHAEHLMMLSKYKKHFVVEKPMALTLTDAEAMIRTCDKNGMRLFVVQQNRYNKPIQALRNALEAGRFGKLVMGTVRVRWCRKQNYYDQDKWRGTWRYDGGVLTNQASHHIDMLTWMMGDVDSVFAYAATQLVKIEVEDTACAVLKFTNGALGVVEATTATRPKDQEGSISVLGERGMVEVGGFAMNEIRTWQFDSNQPGDELLTNDTREQPANVYGFGHASYLHDVVTALKTGKGGLVDGLEGMKSLRLINAMYESAETKEEIKLRFNPVAVRLGRTTSQS